MEYAGLTVQVSVTINIDLLGGSERLVSYFLGKHVSEPAAQEPMVLLGFRLVTLFYGPINSYGQVGSEETVLTRAEHKSHTATTFQIG